jgi:hypothetical protein
MMILPSATALPANTGDGYVAGAYIVFFVILLIYVAIMALRLSHVQRDLRDLQARSGSAAPPQPGGAARAQSAEGSAAAERPSPGEVAGGAPHEQTREREPV